MNALRIIIAFILAPLMAPLVLVIAAVFRGNPSSVHALGALFLIYTPFAYIAVLVLGVPAFFLFRFFRFKGAAAHLLTGAVIGLTAALLILYVFGANAGRGHYVWFALAGGMSALTFWLIAYGFGSATRPLTTRGET